MDLQRILGIIGATSVAIAHYDSGLYIYNQDRNDWADPMNLVFYSIDYYNPNNRSGWASVYESQSHVNDHMQWTDQDRNGTDMKFWDHGALLPYDLQSANSCAGCAPRRHIRFKQGADADPNWGPYTAAAIHYEEYRLCDFGPFTGVPAHVSQDFDNVRDGVWSWMNQQDPVSHSGMYTSFTNNTNAAPQCDGSNPHSFDGYTRWIKAT